MLTICAVVLVGYLVGSIPAGFLVAKLAGLDIRTVGSGNIGATNVLRALGKRYGYPVFAFDFLKGFIAVKVSALIIQGGMSAVSSELAGIIGGICSVLGHSFPVWLGFRGGKGVATSGGVVFGLMPGVAAIAGLIWIAVFQATRYVSLASVAAVLAIPGISGVLLIFGRLHAPALFYFSLGMAAIVLIRHRSNLVRLLSGEEARFTRK